MIEGWSGDDYLILFVESETPSIQAQYNFERLLPGFQIVGLRSWGDFIVRDPTGHTFSVPTIPTDKQHLERYTLPSAPVTLSPDERFSGKIKWYVQPIAFGSDPNVGLNVTWVSHEQHAQLVQWWNKKYRSAQGKKV